MISSRAARRIVFTGNQEVRLEEFEMTAPAAGEVLLRTRLSLMSTGTENFGTVVIQGDTGAPTKQNLTSDVIRRGLTIVGAHDSHDTDEWNNRTIAELFFSLVASDRFALDGVNSHSFRPDQCERRISPRTAIGDAPWGVPPCSHTRWPLSRGRPISAECARNASASAVEAGRQNGRRAARPTMKLGGI